MKSKKKIALLTALAVTVAGLGAVRAYAMQGRSYHIYNYNQNKQTGSYTLIPELLNTTSTYSIVPPTDDRVLYGSSGIVSLSSGGTGFVVDDHTIATAAHCVYDWKTSSYVQDLTITLYDDKRNVVDVIEPDESHVPVLYKESLDGVYFQYDYALLTVSEDLSDYEHYALGEVLDTAERNATIPVYVCGFPQDLYDEDDNPRLFIAAGRFHDFEDLYIKYTADTESGVSGGPVFVQTRYQIGTDDSVRVKTVVGINTHGGTGFNQGVRVTPYLLQFYNNNSNTSYEE